MTRKSNPPSVSEVAFDCPFCGAYTTQAWFALCAGPRPEKARTPFLPDAELIQTIRSDTKLTPELRNATLERFERIAFGDVFLEEIKGGKYTYAEVQNLNISKCFACKRFAVWVHNRLLFPPTANGPAPNDDLPPDVRSDYDEASQILRLSPRGSAALLRLAIQKLCVALGEKGKSIDDDIASLVKKGLSPLVQKSLDSVRVIGNEAVHPGTLDLRDDPAIAEKLFRLVNIVSEQMISNPKHVAEVYEQIPDGKRAAIERRDAPKK